MIMNKKCVIGIGNPLRKDDGIGIILLKKLIDIKKELPKNINYIDGGTSGFNLLHVISKYDLVLFLDAINFKGNPGETRLFKFKDIENKKIPIRVSTHGEDILKVIDMSKELYNKPKEIYFYGVNPENVEYGCGLSDKIKKRIDVINKDLLREVKNLLK